MSSLGRFLGELLRPVFEIAFEAWWDRKVRILGDEEVTARIRADLAQRLRQPEADSSVESGPGSSDSGS